MVLASCDLHTGDVTFTGQTSWLNPYGYLPGELYYFLPFFGTMAAAPKRALLPFHALPAYAPRFLPPAARAAGGVPDLMLHQIA